MEFTKERIEKIRQALIHTGYKSEPMLDGRVIRYWQDDADGCMLPAPDGDAFSWRDTPVRAKECIMSMIRLTGKPLLDLGPLTTREEAYVEDTRYWQENCAREVRKTDRIRTLCEPFTVERGKVLEMVRSVVEQLALARGSW